MSNPGKSSSAEKRARKREREKQQKEADRIAALYESAGGKSAAAGSPATGTNSVYASPAASASGGNWRAHPDPPKQDVKGKGPDVENWRENLKRDATTEFAMTLPTFKETPASESEGSAVDVAKILRDNEGIVGDDMPSELLGSMGKGSLSLADDQIRPLMSAISGLGSSAIGLLGMPRLGSFGRTSRLAEVMRGPEEEARSVADIQTVVASRELSEANSSSPDFPEHDSPTRRPEDQPNYDSDESEDEVVRPPSPDAFEGDTNRMSVGPQETSGLQVYTAFDAPVPHDVVRIENTLRQHWPRIPGSVYNVIAQHVHNFLCTHIFGGVIGISLLDKVRAMVVQVTGRTASPTPQTANNPGVACTGCLQLRTRVEELERKLKESNTDLKSVLSGAKEAMNRLELYYQAEHADLVDRVELSTQQSNINTALDKVNDDLKKVDDKNRANPVASTSTARTITTDRKWQSNSFGFLET